MVVKDLLVQYFNNATQFRNDHIDSDNVSFHRENELKIKVPKSWDVHSRCIEALLESKSRNNVYVLYSGTPCYANFHGLVEQISKNADYFKYCSFFELQCAIMNSHEDIRLQQRITQEIANSTIVVVLDAGGCTQAVLQAVRQYTNGSLVLIE